MEMTVWRFFGHTAQCRMQIM